SVAFSPDGKYIVSGSDDKTIHLWSVETDNAYGVPYQDHTDSVLSVAFSPDGNYLVSGSDNDVIYLRCSFSFMHWDKSYDFCNGWVTSPLHTSQYLFWVPPRYRSLLWTPGTVMIFHPSSIQLDLSNFMHGSQWASCKSVIQNCSS
ncbi:hypothetical protein M422DRAFT_155927, partial [Sphaerobolus stellatus SS14]